MNSDDLNNNKNVIEELKRKVPITIEKILWEEGQRIMNESVQICPVDTGRLRSSRYVRAPKTHGNETTVEMGYDTDYAIFVHENLEAFHKAPTQAKFLETPIRQNLPEIKRRIAERMETEFQ